MSNWAQTSVHSGDTEGADDTRNSTVSKLDTQLSTIFLSERGVPLDESGLGRLQRALKVFQHLHWKFSHVDYPKIVDCT